MTLCSSKVKKINLNSKNMALFVLFFNFNRKEI